MDLVSQTSHLPGMLHGDYLSMSYVCLTSVHRDNFVHRGGRNPFSTFGLFFFVFIPTDNVPEIPPWCRFEIDI